MSFHAICLNALVTCLTSLINPLSLVSSIFLLLLSRYFKWYKLTPSDARRFQKKVLWSTEEMNGNPSGFMVGRGFLGFLCESDRGPARMQVLSLISSHKAILNSKVVQDSGDNEAPPTISEDFTLWLRDGGFDDLFYVKISVPIGKHVERPFQTFIVDSVMQIYERKSYAVVVIAGNPGCGKSSVYKHLIRRFSVDLGYTCNFTHQFSLTDPGDSFTTVFTRVGPEKKSPLIVLLDEIDGTLTRIGGSGIPQHLHYPIQVKNKRDWNTFLDEIDSGFYMNTIFIMTTNLTIDALDEIDPSYTRKGRTDARFDIKDDGSVVVH